MIGAESVDTFTIFWMARRRGAWWGHGWERVATVTQDSPVAGSSHTMWPWRGQTNHGKNNTKNDHAEAEETLAMFFGSGKVASNVDFPGAPVDPRRRKLSLVLSRLEFFIGRTSCPDR